MPRNLPPAHPELPEPSRADTALIRSFGFHLRSEGKAARTQEIYLMAVRLHARWVAQHLTVGLDEISRNDMKSYLVWMLEAARKRNGEPYAPGYINNQFRAIQAFYKWLSEDEGITNPMVGLAAPKAQQPLVPIVEDDQQDALLDRFARKKDFDSRRNYALLRLFFATGARLSELTMLNLDDIDLDNGRASVIGKGGKPRWIKFDVKTIRAVDLYLRVRMKHKLAGVYPNLWLGSNHRPPLTPNGVRQCLRKVAQDIGFHLHPHMFRHNFAHRWLDAGGPEGELMELMGWDSPQMLRRYGASARSARAQRTYDRMAEQVLGGR